MRWKTTVVLLLVTIGIGTYLSLYEIRQPSPEHREQLSKHILDISPEAVSRLSLEVPSGTVSLAREGATWRLDPHRARADGDRVNRVLLALSPLVAQRIMSPASDKAEKTPLDPSAFGLDPPIAKILLTADHQPRTLLVGDTTPVQGNRYVKLNGQPEIFVVSASLFDLINQPVHAFRDPLLVRFSAWLVDTISVTSPTSTFALKRRDNAWHLTQPLNDLADQSAVTQFLNQVSGLRITRYVNDTPQVEQLTEWGLDRPTAEVTLQQPGASPETMTLFFGKPLADDATSLYAKRSDEPTLYAVASSAVDALLGSPQNLRARTCFDVLIGEVVKLEITREATTWMVEKNDTQWQDKGSGATLDSQRVEELLQAVADVQVIGFVEDHPQDLARYGLQPPAGTIALWTANLEDPKKLLIGGGIDASAERYGRIEGREAIVRLPESITGLLDKTPEQLRPAAAPNSQSLPQPSTLPPATQ